MATGRLALWRRSGPAAAGPGPGARWRGPLRPVEMAEAAVLADVAVALCLLGWLLPFGSVFLVAAVTPMAAIAARNRGRAVIAGAMAGMTVAFLIAGSGLATNVGGCAILGALLGVAWRRHWGPLRMVAATILFVWPPIAAAADAGLAIFAGLRKLTLAQVVNGWTGTSRSLRQLGLIRLTRLMDPVVRAAVRYWWLTVPAGLLVLIVTGACLSRALAWPALRRLQRTGFLASADAERPAAPPDPRPAGPVPVQLTGVSYQYPGAPRPALRDLTLTVQAGEFVAVVGPNGSGKSTLTRILGGRPPTSGDVRRPGAVAIGGPGGTAMIFQRPESQVLGVRVRDDLVWGLPSNHGVDIDGLLHRVGLAGFADRETSTLSGGELQRLAVAAALARRPSLLISDESTAMVDGAGRQLLTTLFADLAAEDGIAVVHVTHRAEEAARANHALSLSHGLLLDDPPQAPAAPLATNGERPVVNAERPVVNAKRPVVNAERSGRATSSLPASAAGLPRRPSRASGLAPATGQPVLQLTGVGHVYSARSPWAHRALDGVNLSLHAGDGVLVLGHNGSGKSTLAWILAGLLVPSEGTALLDGRPVDERVGQVALSFQHARLQLLRSRVRADVQAAAGVDASAAEAAIELVGLDPAEVGAKSIDQLSGGQQRRIALAGMLARRPKVLVLDEPFAGLDTEGRIGLIEVLRRLQAEAAVTLVLVSHDTEGADRLAQRAVLLEKGRIAAEVAIDGLTDVLAR